LTDDYQRRFDDPCSVRTPPGMQSKEQKGNLGFHTIANALGCFPEAESVY
jgi:hypothetical protein